MKACSEHVKPYCLKELYVQNNNDIPLSSYKCSVLADEFQVGVLNNPAAKRYNLLGNYTAKIDDKNFALYSASGLISTNFSVNISDIWRVKVAPECTNITVDSNFVVIDIRWYVINVHNETSKLLNVIVVACNGLL